MQRELKDLYSAWVARSKHQQQRSFGGGVEVGIDVSAAEHSNTPTGNAPSTSTITGNNTTFGAIGSTLGNYSPRLLGARWATDAASQSPTPQVELNSSNGATHTASTSAGGASTTAILRTPSQAPLQQGHPSFTGSVDLRKSKRVITVPVVLQTISSGHAGDGGADDSSNNNECSVCMEEGPQQVMVIVEGCSHVLCTQCVAKVRKCPFCRGPIASALESIQCSARSQSHADASGKDSAGDRSTCCNNAAASDKSAPPSPAAINVNKAELGSTLSSAGEVAPPSVETCDSQGNNCRASSSAIACAAEAAAAITIDVLPPSGTG